MLWVGGAAESAEPAASKEVVDCDRWLPTDDDKFCDVRLTTVKPTQPTTNVDRTVAIETNLISSFSFPICQGCAYTSDVV